MGIYPIHLVICSHCLSAGVIRFLRNLPPAVDLGLSYDFLTVNLG